MNTILCTHFRSIHGPDGDAYASGFLYALQCNPEPVYPNDWMNRLLWNGPPGEFESKQHVMSVVKPLVQEWEQVEKRLRQGKPGVWALVNPGGVPLQRVLERLYYWTAGFFDGAYLEDHDFIGQDEGDQSAISFLELILSAGVQRGFAGADNELYRRLQSEELQSLLRDELIAEILPRIDTQVMRAYRHFRGIEPIELHLLAEDESL